MPTLRVRLLEGKTLLAADIDGKRRNLSSFLCDQNAQKKEKKPLTIESVWKRKGNSDPYAILTVGDQNYKSRIILKTLNPLWNQTFEFPISDPNTQVLRIDVFDHDDIGSDDSLGSAVCSFDDLILGIEKLIWMRLEGGSEGENITGIVKKETLKNIANIFGSKKRSSSSSTEQSHHQQHQRHKSHKNRNQGQIKMGLTALDFNGTDINVSSSFLTCSSSSCLPMYNSSLPLFTASLMIPTSDMGPIPPGYAFPKPSLQPSSLNAYFQNIIPESSLHSMYSTQSSTLVECANPTHAEIYTPTPLVP